MKDLPFKAKIFIIATILLALALLVPTFAKFEFKDILLTLALCVITSLTQIFKVQGSTDKSSYNISWILYGFSLVLLGAPHTIIVILVSHIVEWIKSKYKWVIPTFNIASFIIVTITSGLVLSSLKTAFPNPEIFEIPSILASLATFTILNHLMIGLIIKYARGQGLKESGVLSGYSLVLDFTLLCLGAGSAYIWIINPLGTILNIIPIYLIYTTLKVPALQRKTDIDQKTELFNSKYFSETVEKELSRSNRFDRPLTVVMADLDFLRNVNNAYGHLAGDEVIIGVANILKSSFREYDIISRFGGEEFAILMPETTLDEAIPRVEEIRKSIEEYDFEVSTSVEPIKVTMSFGIAEREGSDQTKDQLLHNADKALYHAKLSGRNQLSVHGRLSESIKNNIEMPLQVDQPCMQPGPEQVAEVSQGANGHSVGKEELKVQKAAIENSQPEHPETKNNPIWKVRRFVGVLAVLAATFFFILVRFDFQVDLFGLLTFAALAMLAEGLSIDIYVKDSSVSTSAVPFIAGLLLYGPVGAGVIGIGIAFAAWFKNRSPIHRLIFNMSNHVIGGLLCSILIITAGGQTPSNYAGLLQFIFSLIFGGLLFLSTTGLVSTAIGIDKSVSIRAVWNEHFHWLGPIYIAMGAMGYALMLGFQTAKMLGVIAIIAPIMILRLSQFQYLERTEDLVKKLKTTLKDLGESSGEINMLNADLLDVLADVIDLRDPYVLGHSQNVARNARRLAQEMGLPSEQITSIFNAGLLHDLGKIGIPEEILQKPGTLTIDEYETIKKHPVISAKLIENGHSLQHLIPIIRHHHEKFDGTGYPDGLCGTDIPIESRIIAMADVVEAMSSDRPYREALEPKEILDEVNQMNGKHLDPQVVEVFLKLATSEEKLFFQNSASKVCEEINGNAKANHPWVQRSVDLALPI